MDDQEDNAVIFMINFYGSYIGELGLLDPDLSQLNWKKFRSYLFQSLLNMYNEEDVSVSYNDEEGDRLPIESEEEYQEALKVAKQKAKKQEKLVLEVSHQASSDSPLSFPFNSRQSLCRIKESLLPRNKKVSKAVETESSSSLHFSTTTNLSEDTDSSPPVWFLSYMKNFEERIVSSVCSRVTSTIEARLHNAKGSCTCNYTGSPKRLQKKGQDYEDKKKMNKHRVEKELSKYLGCQDFHGKSKSCRHSSRREYSKNRWKDDIDLLKKKSYLMNDVYQGKSLPKILCRLIEKRQYEEAKNRILTEVRPGRAKKIRIDNKVFPVDSKVLEAAQAKLADLAGDPCSDSSKISGFNATFISDVTYPDGSKVYPGEKFTKIWKVKNSGHKTWDDKVFLYKWNLVRFQGSPSRRKLVPSSKKILCPELCHEEIGQISVDFTAPQEPGWYATHWRFCRKGAVFGNQLWCAVEVIDRLSDNSSELEDISLWLQNYHSSYQKPSLESFYASENVLQDIPISHSSINCEAEKSTYSTTVQEDTEMEKVSNQLEKVSLSPNSGEISFERLSICSDDDDKKMEYVPSEESLSLVSCQEDLDIAEDSSNEDEIEIISSESEVEFLDDEETDRIEEDISCANESTIEAGISEAVCDETFTDNSSCINNSKYEEVVKPKDSEIRENDDFGDEDIVMHLPINLVRDAWNTARSFLTHVNQEIKLASQNISSPPARPSSPSLDNQASSAPEADQDEHILNALTKLEDMGFSDRALNICMLRKHNNDITMTVAELVLNNVF